MAKFLRYCSLDSKVSSATFSSVADCIINSNFALETHQVKLLAVALSYEEMFFQEVLKFLDILQYGAIDFSKSKVLSEISMDGGSKRADVIIDCRDKKGVTRSFVLIEAKRMANCREASNHLKLQLERYRKALARKIDDKKILAVALAQTFCAIDGCRLLKWSDVAQIADNVLQKMERKKVDPIRLRLFQEFRDKFVSGESKMKWYEEEVVSIPAGNTSLGVEKYGVYACSNDAKHKYRPSLFMAFRPSGGDMKVLYKVEERYLLGVNDISDIESLGIDKDHKDRIIRFLEDKEASHYDYGKDGQDVMFYVLDQEHSIKLNPAAHSSKQSSTKYVYYFLSDILDPNKRMKLRPASSFRWKKQKKRRRAK